MELMQFSLTKTMQVTVGYSLIYDSCQEARELLFQSGAWIYPGFARSSGK